MEAQKIKKLKGGKKKMGKNKLKQPIINNWICERCGHEWLPRTPKKPKVCPKCKSAWWDEVRENPSKQENEKE